MAEKEATVYVVDVGSSMGRKCHGRQSSDLDWGMNYIWDKIATTVGTGRKTAGLGVVSFRSNSTSHDLAGEDSYKNINVLQRIGQCTTQTLRELREQIRPSHTDDGDAISALVVAMDMIQKHCRHLKFKRRIELLTNGTGSMDDQGINEIAEKLKEDQIQLIVVGVDFDDKDFGFKEEDKDDIKSQNESILKDLVEQSEGVLGTLAEAIEELKIPRLKTVRPIPSYKGTIALGKPGEYDSALVLDVERYSRTYIARPPGASSFAVRTRADETGSAQSSATITNDSNTRDDVNVTLSSVHTDRKYEVIDSNNSDQRQEVTRDSLSKGYEYGRTLVPISESDENVTKLETAASLDIVGFIPWDHFDRYLSMSTTNIIVAKRVNDKARIAMSSLVHALSELQDYAVARLVTKDGREPHMVLLAPSIDVDLECLLEIEIPFAEDIRGYKFPPLDRIMTVSGKVLIEHRNLPRKELQGAMDDYVDQMDLSTFGKGESGPEEYMALDDTYSPVLHRLQQAIRFRATHPDQDIPPAAEILTKYAKPSEELLERASDAVKALTDAADVKKVPPRALSRKQRFGGREQEQPRSGLDVSALLNSRSKSNEHKISPNNAVPEFKQLMKSATDLETIHDGITQLGQIVRNWITHSIGDSSYDRALEAISCMREECFEMEEANIFNVFMQNLKASLLDGTLGGERREMWWKIRATKLGLLEKKHSVESTVTEDEAKAFLSPR